jgi:hypothetical protein
MPCTLCFTQVLSFHREESDVRVKNKNCKDQAYQQESERGVFFKKIYFDIVLKKIDLSHLKGWLFCE